MKRTYVKILTAIAMLACGAASLTAADSVSGLNAKDFNKYWRIESEGPCEVTFRGDTAEFVAPKGLSVWRKDKMKGRTVIEYDAQVVTENPDDRLSDLNCFWMASDPNASDIWKISINAGANLSIPIHCAYIISDMAAIITRQPVSGAIQATPAVWIALSIVRR